MLITRDMTCERVKTWSPSVRQAAPQSRRRRPRARRSPPSEPLPLGKGLRVARSARRPRTLPSTGGKRHSIVAYDFGAKRNILRSLAACGLDVTVVPANTPAEAVLERKPDGVFLSNGPGDPQICCLRHQTIRENAGAGCRSSASAWGTSCSAHTFGGKTFKMKFGHHGGNQPVIDLTTEQGRDHLAEPQLRRRRLDAAWTARQGGDHPREPERPHGRGAAPRATCRCSRCSTTPRRHLDHTTRCICSDASSSCSRRPARHRARDDVRRRRSRGG